MLPTVLPIVGLTLIVLALVLHAARRVAIRDQTRKRAELIRLRLQDEPGAQRVVYREVPIRLSGR